MLSSPLLASAPTRGRTHSPDGEPLCDPPEPGDICEAGRRRMPEVESDLRRRLSGPDRSIEAIELEAIVSGLRPASHGPSPGHHNGNGGNGGPGPALGDPLLESGVLALCAAQVLSRPAAVHLGEGLALRGLRVQRGTLLPGQPPRALDAIGLFHRHGHGLLDRRDADPIDLYRADPATPAARALFALSAAGLSRPVVVIAPASGTPGTNASPAFHYAGLLPTPAPLSAPGTAPETKIDRLFAPHAAVDAAVPLLPLFRSLSGRNPWLLYRMAESAWPPPRPGPFAIPLFPHAATHAPHYIEDAWQAARLLLLPQLTPEGVALAHQVLGRDPDPDECFALACRALWAAARLSSLQAEPHRQPGSADLPDEADLEAELDRLTGALWRLLRRPLLPGQDGEAPLFLRLLQNGGAFVLDSRHPDEMGRLLAPAGAGCYARLRLFHFPKEVPHALSVAVQNEENPQGRPIAWYVDGGDLRVHVELVHGGSLLRGLAGT